MGQIFLSYAREDVESAREIYRLLTENRFSVWMDEQELLPGQDWKLAIEKAIRACDIFVACLSNKSVPKRGYIQRELRMAYEILDTIPEEKVFIIPIRLDSCEVPSRLENIHRLDFFELGSKEKLINAIRLHINLPDRFRDIQPVRQPADPFSNIPMPKRKKEFTQFEKDRFAKESFKYIKQYFQRALRDIEAYDTNIQTEFEETTSLSIANKIYVAGALKAQCSIWLGDNLIPNAIYYNDGLHIWSQDSINDYIPVIANGEELCLHIGNFGLSMIQVDQAMANQQQAAEYLWRRLTYRLESH